MWYGQVRLAPIETVVSLLPLGLPDDPVRRIHPRIVDTNAILDQLVASIRKPKPIALMTTIRDGGLRLHITPELLQEVPEKILTDRDMARRCARHQTTKEVVLARWREEMLPRVRVVDVGAIDRVELAGLTDFDDAGTAQLANILGPGSTWSRDPDLTELGLAEPYVLEIVIAIREVCVVDVQIATTSKQLTLLTNLGGELVRALGRLDARGRAMVGAATVVALIAIGVAMYKKPHLRDRIYDALQTIVEHVLHEITDAYALRQVWADRVPPALSLETPRSERAIARVLASAPAPFSIDEIHEVLAARGHALTPADIVRELRNHSMFVLAERGLWQLGGHVAQPSRNGH